MTRATDRVLGFAAEAVVATLLAGRLLAWRRAG